MSISLKHQPESIGGATPKTGRCPGGGSVAMGTQACRNPESMRLQREVVCRMQEVVLQVAEGKDARPPGLAGTWELVLLAIAKMAML